MSSQKILSLDEIAAMSSVMHMQTPDELRVSYERLLGSMDPELRERFRALEAHARAMPPKPELSKITPASLAALSGEELDGAVYRYVATRIEDAADRCEALLALPRGLQVFYLSFIVEVEVMNGGLDQFFYNASSEMAALVAPALRDLRAEEAATMFELAVRIAASLPPLYAFEEDGSLQHVVESQAERDLAQLDRRFCPMAEKFQSLRAAFLKEREGAFFAIPD